MHQIIYNLLSVSLALVILVAAYLLGSFLLQKTKLEKRINARFNSALSVLLGYGLISLVALVLSFFGPINKFVVYGLLLLVLVFRYKKLFSLPRSLFTAWGDIKQYDIWEKVFLLGIIFGFLFYLTSALTPPYRTDALAYHLPEAIGVSEQGINFLVQGTKGNFFRNVPASVEVMDASLYSLGGFTPIHLIHYSILLAALFLLFQFVREYFDRSKALLAVLLIFSLYDLFVNGTNAYVDAVMIAWELSGFLSLLLWSKSKESAYLVLAGVFYGLALGTKYNALYGVLLAGLILLLYLIKDKNKTGDIVKKIFYFVWPIIIVAGFWYGKNLILYGNPVYPFYFGHPGFDDAVYAQMAAGVKSFIVERNLLNFILLPVIFFFKSYYLVLFLAFISWPLIFLYKKFNSEQKQVFRVFTFYIFVYSLLWFFVITHQLKFFYGPMIILLVILAVQLDIVRRFILKYINQKVAGLIILVLLAGLIYKITTAKNNYFINVKKADLAYSLGLDDRSEFYQRKNMGGAYRVSEYINNNSEKGIWLNIWRMTSFFLSTKNKLVYPSDFIYDGNDVSTTTLLGYLQKNGINRALVDNNGKTQAMSDEFLSQVCARDYQCSYYRQREEAIERIVVDSFAPFYDQDGIKLYDLKF